MARLIRKMVIIVVVTTICIVAHSPQPAVQIFEPLTSPALNAEPSTIKSKGRKITRKLMTEEDQLVQHMLLVKMRTNNTNVELSWNANLQGHTSNATTVNGSGKPYKSPNYKMARILKSRTFFYKSV